MKNTFLIVAALILFSLTAYADGRHSIKIVIKDYKDSALLLTSYYGDKIILVDTAYAEEPGVFIFEGEELFPEGIYMAVSSSKIKLFEFIVGADQEFSLSTDTTNYTLNLQPEGSVENKIFFDYMRNNESLYRKNQSLNEQLAQTEKGSEKYHFILDEIDSINRLAGKYKLNVIENHPRMLVSALFKAMQDVEIPDEVLSSTDSLSGYKYYKAHYWDKLDLSDVRLLRTPMLAKKTGQYFDQLVVMHPDSVIAGIEELIERARPSEETISWLIWHFTSEYQSPEYMGFDVVFIHLVDNQFVQEEIANLTPSVLESLQDRADKMRPLVLGNEAPNLVLTDTAGNYQSFHSLTNKYIILYFWDYDCGICRNESILLKEIYKENKYDLEVFAVNVNSDLDKWKAELVEKDFEWINVNGTRSVTQNFHDLYDTYGTPAIFILDKDRKIIAKRISAKQIIGFIENYQLILKK